MDPVQTGAGVESLFSFLENQATLSFAPSEASRTVAAGQVHDGFKPVMGTPRLFEGAGSAAGHTKETKKKKSTGVSWAERIEAAIVNSGGQASLKAILHFIELRFTDVAAVGYDWKRTISFTLQGGDQFKKVGSECGGVWQMCQPTEEVPPWELNNLELKRIIEEEAKTKKEKLDELDRQKLKLDSRKSTRKRRSHSPRKRSKSRSRSRSRSRRSRRSRSRSRDRERKRSERRHKSSRRNAEEEKRVKRRKSEDGHSTLKDRTKPTTKGAGEIEPFEDFQAALRAKLEAQAQQDMASAVQGRGEPLGPIDISAGGIGKTEGNEEHKTEPTSTSEKVEVEGEAVIKSKEEEILELYLKQHQQDKQSKQPGDHEDLTGEYGTQPVMAHEANSYDYSSTYGYYSGYSGYTTDPAAWEQYQAQYAQWTAYYTSMGGAEMTTPMTMMEEGGDDLGEEGGKKKGGKKPTPEFWKAYKEKKRRRKAATRFNLKG